MSVALFKLLMSFVCSDTLSCDSSVDLIPRHYRIIKKPVNYEDQGFNVVLVSTLLQFQISYRTEPNVANVRACLILCFVKFEFRYQSEINKRKLVLYSAPMVSPLFHADVVRLHVAVNILSFVEDLESLKNLKAHLESNTNFLLW